MKKIVMLLCLSITALAYASPPARLNTYTSGELITAADVTANEDAVFNYLQAGVDTIKDATIVNADVSGTANIQASKLNLTSINQSIANTGTLTNTGNVTVTGNAAISAKITGTGLVVSTRLQHTGLGGAFSNGEATLCISDGGIITARDGGCN